ncbi:hypothetical protein NG895_05600 [Aeoliella sp. ICT_H6.2]|uniref:Uncharacterized protein n=1 Tax=Aeoliella straminimaris TaxID=2954799 RepID=A0A9X2JEU6_9BACT|nr:hypothetical protein [Aeoliella straminimaris]MCO6043375.1 hypothetical protein [Aeoliella straminimaris]
MNGVQLAWYLGIRAVAVVVGLYLLHRLALGLEARGLIYYLNKKPNSSGVTAAAWEFDRLTRPSVEHHVAAEDEQVESEENDGE